jgi:hypothetical protein
MATYVADGVFLFLLFTKEGKSRLKIEYILSSYQVTG